ncbi:MAG: HYR domain-containing protein, partial [Saprospiraceae bacterium]
GNTVFLEGETTVTYTVTDWVGNTATCSFTVTVNCLTISGRIIWEHDGVSGVKNATVNAANVLPTPPFMGSDLSDTNGDYGISVPVGGTYKLTPVKNTGGNAGRMNGVDAADATRITNHVNFSNPITNPYKKVCADVNRSGIINTQDATLITQCIAGNPTAQAVFNVFWRFTPTDYPMPGTPHQNVPAFPAFKDVPIALLDVLGINFYGMKIGDVDAAWANPQNTPNLAPLVWMLKDQTLVAGTELDLSFEASNFNDLAAYQMALDFDPTQLQFVGFQPLSAIPMNLLDNFGAYNADLGELRNVWSVGAGTTLTDGTAVFRAKFKVLKSGQKLSDVLKLDDSEIPCKAYSEALVPTDMKLVFTESVGTDVPHDLGNQQLQLMQNRPNPFSGATTIGFILPESCEAHIRILDISGRELASYDRKYTAGYHELDFRMENAWTYGMLFCELVTPQGKRTIKMMTAK